MRAKPYLWRIPDSFPESAIGEYVRSGSPDRFVFKQGCRLPDNVGVPVVRFSTSLGSLSRYSCLPNSAMVPLIRNDFGAKLSEVAGADVQLVKAVVQAQDQESSDFSILNVTSKVMGIDKENSAFVLIPGTDQIMSFKRLTYLDCCLGEHMLARDAEYLSHLLVSAKLVEILGAKDISGVEFLSSDEITVS